MVEKLELYIEEGNVNCFYKVVFVEMVANKNLTFESVSFDHKQWNEIDEEEKLSPAELQTADKHEKTFA